MADDMKDEIYYTAIELLQQQVRALAPLHEKGAVADLWESQLQRMVMKRTVKVMRCGRCRRHTMRRCPPCCSR